MIAQVARWGNSLALRIPSPLARMVDIQEGGAVELTIDRGRLIITPVVEGPVYELAALVAGITDDNLHGETDTGSAVGNEF